MAQTISASRLHDRLDLETLPSELVGLATAFNGMLARLEDSFRRLSDFSSDLAHELQTPLSNVMTQTQVALSRPRTADEYREVLYSSLEECDRLARTIADMLFLAKADNGLMLPRVEAVDVPAEVRRLFENYVEVERAYYRKTRIFPIMHVIAIRRDVYEQNRWIAMSLYKAFVEAQRICYHELYETAALRNMLPWMIAEIEWLRREMGDDWWPYGYAPNRHGLDTFLRYHHEQGLSKRRLQPEELFVPETLEAYKI